MVCLARTSGDKVVDIATGTLVTAATWLRDYVTSHLDYKHDSVVSAQINFDLMKAIDEVERGVRPAPELLGKDFKPPSDVQMDGKPATEGPGCSS
jgi:glutamate--cysteine ligase catalytic subunit